MKADCKDDHERYQGPVHQMFGLTYAAYYTVPRLMLQGMPLWWQRLFVWLVSMLPDSPEYVCQRRDGAGRFIKDPWANYRRGSIAQILHEEANPPAEVKDWKILDVEHSQG